MEFKRHFDRRDLEKLFGQGFELPDDFMFGVANAAYQVEGGYNGPGEPLNNWVELERAGKAEPAGEAVRFWTDYPEHIELANGMGLNGFRMSLEWARVQPGNGAASGGVPEFDEAAIEAYADMLAALMRAGLEPVVTLHHFTHPYWLGIDLWLERDKLALFRAYVEKMAQSLNAILIEKHSLRPIRHWVTINEPNVYALLTYTLPFFPHGTAGLSKAAQCWSNMIDAHCRAYDAVHQVYESNGWDDPLVSCNNFHFSTYYLDKVMTDLMLARRNGVGRGDLHEYVESSKAAWDAEIAKSPHPVRSPWLSIKLERLVDRLTPKTFSLERFADGIDALYSSPLPDKLDYLSVDYYDAFLRYHVKFPSLSDVREGRFTPNAELWEQVLNPAALYHFLKGETINGDGLSVIVLESGMCYRVHQGMVEPRHDGATRDRFLQSYIYEVLRALKDGVPVKGYEWGSYEPRFGLYTVDRSRSPVRISSVDAWGVNAGKVYGDIIAALERGDRERLYAAFSNDD
jgi:beta-glucosidase